jgi:hypothetical protein
VIKGGPAAASGSAAMEAMLSLMLQSWHTPVVGEMRLFVQSGAWVLFN